MKINSNKKINIILFVFILIMGIFIVSDLLQSNYKSEKNQQINNSIEKNGEVFEIDNLENYTWEQYSKLSPEEKLLIPDMFEDMDEYNKWYENMLENKGGIEKIDELEKGMEIEDFTWEQYEQLTIGEKAIFPDYFDTFEEYKKWYQDNKED